jgi:hypothetical protein
MVESQGHDYALIRIGLENGQSPVNDDQLMPLKKSMGFQRLENAR